jgi:hypothetical protein
LVGSGAGQIRLAPDLLGKLSLVVKADLNIEGLFDYPDVGCLLFQDIKKGGFHDQGAG